MQQTATTTQMNHVCTKNIIVYIFIQSMRAPLTKESSAVQVTIGKQHQNLQFPFSPLQRIKDFSQSLKRGRQVFVFTETTFTLRTKCFPLLRQTFLEKKKKQAKKSNEKQKW